MTPKPPRAKKAEYPKWVDTRYGVRWGDLLKIVRVASNRDGEHNRFAVLEVTGKDGIVVTITAQPTMTHICITPRKEARRGK